MFFAKTSWIFPCSKRLDIPIIWISWTCRMISQAPRLLRATLKASSAVKLHGPTDRRCRVTSPGGSGATQNHHVFFGGGTQKTNTVGI